MIMQQVEESKVLSADACWDLLASRISPDQATRDELRDAGIACHTVDALYPAPFQPFAADVFRGLSDHGTDHLRLAAHSSRSWDRGVAVVHRLNAALTPDQEAYAAGFTAFDGADIGEIVFQELYRWHAPDQANDYTHYYIKALYIAYWLTIHPERLAQVNRAKADECVRWVVNALLPKSN